MPSPPLIVAAPDAGATASPSLVARRAIFFALVGATMLVACAAFATAFLKDGLTAIEIALLVLFAANLPWLTIGLWNSLFGWALLRRADGGLTGIVPLAGPDHPPPLAGGVALVMPVHDEDPQAVLSALRVTLASLDATGRSARFDVFVLSDTRDDAIAAAEERLFAGLKRADPRPERLHYRRRRTNTGFKAGNIRDFCERWGSGYGLMIVLDADSVMSGAAILRLVGLMQANPRLGILQTLVTGLPSASAFTRIFQFGMRHGMRVYTAGSAWWQGDAGPYWGHNAIIRLAPFIRHCHLPDVPGEPPLGGPVLSHDQIEAVLMRKAGWEVRVLPVEDGSYEANPPTLPDFTKRDLRWCHGNMQYTRLLGIAGRNRMGRLQMILAILMYTSAPCWLAFCLLGLAQAAAAPLGLSPAVVIAEPSWLPGPDGLALVGGALFFAVVGMSWAPKLLGLGQALADSAARRSYGGAGRLVAGGILELMFSMLLAPVVATAQTAFLARLLLGRRLKWRAQKRASRTVSWSEAAGRLWPQALLGLTLLFGLLATLPDALWWATPVIAGLLLAVPFSVLTARPALGRWLVRWRLCATPEELAPPPEVRAACPWLTATPEAPTQRPDPRRRGRSDPAVPQPEATAAS